MLSVERRHDPTAVERVLIALPDWFGVEEAIVSYTDDAAHLESYLAVEDEAVVGVALVRRHFPESAELHLIAVMPGDHDRGIGRALVHEIEHDLAESGVRLFEVHTVGPSQEDEYYARTRGLYRRLGFVPLQEFDRIDWDGPTLVMVKPL